MPWSAWLESIRTDSIWPLAVAVAAQALYYLIGIERMLRGYPPWGCQPPEPDVDYDELRKAGE